MTATDMPSALPYERVPCAIEAAQRYHIPAAILLAVSEKENGRPGMVNKNKNGTSDIGTMQFNSAYVATLASHGITQADVAAPGCYPYHLAAWRLRRHILFDSGDIWTRASNYHSYTPEHNAAYRADLITKTSVWAQKLAPVALGVPLNSIRLKQAGTSPLRYSVQRSTGRYLRRAISVTYDADHDQLAPVQVSPSAAR